MVFHGSGANGAVLCNSKSVKVEQLMQSYFLPMLKFDPLESAPDVGSESVCQFFIPYTLDEVVIEFPPI